MLAMLDPMTLPIARSLLPTSAACTLTSSSGMDVPMATRCERDDENGDAEGQRQI